MYIINWNTHLLRFENPFPFIFQFLRIMGSTNAWEYAIVTRIGTLKITDSANARLRLGRQ
jgi:hypothetical protein